MVKLIGKFMDGLDSRKLYLENVKNQIEREYHYVNLEVKNTEGRTGEKVDTPQ